MLKVAILGAGAIAGAHIDSFSKIDGCGVVAVCDTFIDKAEALIKNKSLSAKAYKDVEQVLASDIDAVSICLPPGAHASVAIAALNAGKHVLVEKPMAGSLEECDAMNNAAENSGKILSVVSQNRFKTPVQKVKKMLDAGVAGKVLHTVINSLWWRGENYYDIWWRGTWDSEGGGCLTSHAVHHLDLMQWMIGMPRRVTAVISNVGHDNSELEDIGVAILEYPGMIAQVTASIVTHDEEQELIFQCKNGRLSIPWKTAASKALPNGFPENNDPIADEIQKYYDSLPELEHEGHQAQINNFVGAILGKEKPAVSGADGRNTIELISAIYKASCTRSPVELPIKSDDPFYRRDSMLAAMPRFFKKTRSIENFETSTINLGRDVGK